ncbi:hypothetical protein ONZ45_g15022 [Pleurotus djamor]|nr:hypothetical protein ONZ45_g15022 [Pleurotus djamor]
MSAPGFPGPPPLPPGWSQHTAPGGQSYYFNAISKESTYVRPLPAFPLPSQSQQPSKKKTEKPLVKTPIPGTNWLRVKTTEGNVFYTNKAQKSSVWTVPDEIKDAVAALEAEEKEAEGRAAREAEEAMESVKDEQLKEIERIRSEVEGMVKRKAEDPEPVSEVASKKPRIEEDDDDDDSEEEEEWQREAAAQLAAEAEEEKKRKAEEEAERLKAEAEAEAKAKEHPQIVMPERVDLSIEEAKALFKTLLREKDINPLMPWDTSLPLFVSDPRYVLLPSVSARREAFDEYCKERARELRQSQVKKEKEDPKEEFEKLLEQEVKSTRMSWTDFRRSWKKDRRFWGWGRDDREREKRFREFLKELGEKKRQAAQQAEVNFFALLKEHGNITENSVWKEVKRKLVHDPRYDAVGSSSLREELFNTYLKAGKWKDSSSPSLPSEQQSSKTAEDADTETRKKERKERAVKEREQKVKAERGRVEAEIDRSRKGLSKEEGEREFMSLLTDAIREPTASWDSIRSQLETDPRYENSPLSLNHRINLFHQHIKRLSDKYMNGLHSLFETHAPSLATKFTSLPVAEVLASLPASKLGLDIDSLEDEFSRWSRTRSQNARKAFDEMMSENSFVEFWGRLGKIGGEGVDGGVKADDIGEDEGEAFGGKVDMKVLAKNIDVSDIEKVLRNDKRYVMFDHVPDQREQWIRRASMRLLRTFVLALTAVTSYAQLEDLTSDVPKAKHNYQSDVARLRKIVINSLYSHKDIFIRELISNANDAIEKLRLTALKDKSIWDGSNPLNITLKLVKPEGEQPARIIIADTGIGMTPEELTTNLGTLAKSGTSDFLARAENSDATGQGNLIGAFGLGFYSSFLVADRVYVASIPPKTAQNPNPVQHVFSSSADDSSFEIYPDPRGNTIGRGTEITLVLKEDSLEYLDADKLSELINKHSSYSSAFPIYLFTQRTEEVPDEEAQPEGDTTTTSAVEEEPTVAKDEDEAVIEEVSEDKKEEEKPPVKTKTVVVDEWKHLNSQPPIWMRDPKDVTKEEYTDFYKAFFKEVESPLAWHHFSGDSGSGVSFRAIVFVPGRLEESYWQQPLQSRSKDIRLLVKRVFITNDLGEDGLPKWASWVKVVIDAEDLPLNVSRETLQSTRFLKQIKTIIVKHLISMFNKLADEEPGKFERFQKQYGSVLKLGAVEDTKNREKLAALTRFHTNRKEDKGVVSLDQYLENKKKGQKQIFYLAEMGREFDDLKKSVFIEKLDARGYEVLLLNEPLDEILVQNVRAWKKVPFQDVAKAGLKFGDEDSLADEKAELEAAKEKYKPLLDYLKKEVGDKVRDVVVSNRLVKSPCAIVADQHGYTANIERMMNAQNAQKEQDKSMLHEFAKKQKLMEINPRSPLIEGLLRRIEQLPAEEEERDLEAEDEIREVASILVDGALVRSGFEVPDSNIFFERVDRVLRRSLGVSEMAPTDTSVKPAPPVDPELPTEEEEPPFAFPPSFPPEDPNDDGKAKVILPDHMKDKVQIEMEEIDEDGNPVPQHDEL